MYKAIYAMIFDSRVLQVQESFSLKETFVIDKSMDRLTTIYIQYDQEPIKNERVPSLFMGSWYDMNTESVSVQLHVSLLISSQVLLAGPIGPKLRTFISRDIETISPKDTDEEVHVILEFGKGQQWGKATAKCANRVIISHDIANSRMTALEQFDVYLNEFNPNLIIFTGAHMLDGQSRDFWKQRLVDIRNFLKERPRTVPIHFEMATVGNLQFLPHLADEVFPFVDSIGLNEQELISLAKSKEADFDFTQIGPKPSIPDTSDLLHWLFSSYSSQNRTNSRFTRIHFHTLSYDVIVASKRALGGAMWANSLKAVMEGSKVASLQACDTNEISTALHELQIPDKFRLSNTDEVLHRSEIEYTKENGYVAWQREGIDYYMAPVYVCKNPLKTVGLGDAISATGLLTSEFKFLKSKKSKQKS